MNLVYTEDFGIDGMNYYWTRCDAYDLTRDESRNVGVTDARSQVDVSIIPALQKVDVEFRTKGFRLYIKDAYRSPELYKLVYEKRVKKFGKQETDRILNVIDMPHANGRTVDVTLYSLEKYEEVMMRNKEDGADAFFVDYYRERKDAKSQEYQRLQDLLAKTMLKNGFQYGSKMEYWHFTLPSA